MALNDLTFSIVEYTFTQIQTFSCSVKHTPTVVVGLITFRSIVVRKNQKSMSAETFYINLVCVQRLSNNYANTNTIGSKIMLI